MFFHRICFQKIFLKIYDIKNLIFGHESELFMKLRKTLRLFLKEIEIKKSNVNPWRDTCGNFHTEEYTFKVLNINMGPLSLKYKRFTSKTRV